MRRHLAGIDRDGFCHEALKVAAQTDTLHTDQRLLRQHRPKTGTQINVPETRVWVSKGDIIDNYNLNSF